MDKTTKMIVLVSMIRALETGPQEFAPGDVIEVPSDHVSRLIERRIAKAFAVAEKK